jgi:hypothetical protein
MSEKIKDAVLAEAKNSQAVVHDVITSGAYLYPFKVSSDALRGVLFRPFLTTDSPRESSTSQPTKTYGALLSLAPAELSHWE